MGGADLVIVSNRGPLSFSLDDGEQLVARRGAGGLVSSLSPLVAGTATIWIAAAMGEHDRAAAGRGRILPSTVAEELLAGMAAHVSCGFHAPRWAQAFEACCAEVLGSVPPTFVAPLGPDAEDLGRVVSSEESDRWGGWLTSLLGDRQMVLRVDRVELSKNVLRGFLAFDELLAAHPDLRERVTFVALVYASRQGLPEYLAYRTEVEHLANQVNHRWATPGWTPIVLDITDNYPRSVAALRRYDVLLVNPLRDGLNLVAKEGPIVNTNDGLLAP